MCRTAGEVLTNNMGMNKGEDVIQLTHQRPGLPDVALLTCDLVLHTSSLLLA
jgi:hypothetical protein